MATGTSCGVPARPPGARRRQTPEPSAPGRGMMERMLGPRPDGHPGTEAAHSPGPPGSRGALGALVRFVTHHPRLVVLTGAGCSTDSGIPDYRDADGRWKHSRPVLYQDFVRDAAVRRRHWARSLAGWPRFARARPNRAHAAIARLEAQGFVHQVVTRTSTASTSRRAASA
jgi:hypothetical protein